VGVTDDDSGEWMAMGRGVISIYNCVVCLFLSNNARGDQSAASRDCAGLGITATALRHSASPMH